MQRTLPIPRLILILALAAGLCVAWGAPSTSAADPAAAALPPGLVDSFLEKHCFECHDDSVSKGDLNLLDLAFEPGQRRNFSTWQRVFERVRDGEMPPEKEPRPDPANAKQFLADLRQPLLDADRASIARNGRVQSRRLTRVEYEHTMHDLLGIDLPLRTLLPADATSHGFETVAASQQLSSHHLARYLDVADLALENAFDRALEGDEEYRRTHSPKDLSRPTGGNYRGPELRDGKSISWPISLQFFGRMPVTTVPADGWYRITLRGVHAINPGKDGAVWGTLRSGACYSNAPILYMAGLVEATKQPRDLVFETWMRKDHMLELKPNDGELKRAPSGARGGNVSFRGRNLAREGFSGIAHRGIEIERISPIADRKTVQKNLFGDEDFSTWKKKPAAAIDTLVKRFAQRAFRRPVSDEQIGPYRALAKDALADGLSLPDALRAGYRAVLCSPRFLSLPEAPGQLDDYALASRLSYALWVSMPDWTLRQLAAEGKLHDPKVLAAQVERLLHDPRSARFVESFSDQWLKLNEIDFTSPDRRQFPTFDPVLQESMLGETRVYLTELIRNDLGVSHFIDADFAFLNGRLARHYRMELSPTPGGGLQRVALEEKARDRRAGLITQGAILKVTADGSSTSPVVRGVFLNERILGEHIPAPPANIPAIEPDIRGATTVREQLDLHRSSESCMSCHTTIDPPGLALENFDPAGGWRTHYGIGGKGKPVDPAGVTPEGKKFADLGAWRKIYSRRYDQLARGFTEQFLTYATGAPMRFSDRAHVRAMVEETEKNDYGLRSIIHAAVASPIFQKK